MTSPPPSWHPLVGPVLFACIWAVGCGELDDPEPAVQSVDESADAYVAPVIEHRTERLSGASVGSLTLEPQGSQQSGSAVWFQNALDEPVELRARAFVTYAGKKQPVDVALSKEVVAAADSALVSIDDADVEAFAGKTSLWIPTYVEVVSTPTVSDVATDPVRTRLWAAMDAGALSLLTEDEYQVEVASMVEESAAIRDAIAEMTQFAEQSGAPVPKMHVDRIVAYQPEGQ